MGLSRNLCCTHTINHGLTIISQLTNPAVAEQVVERERFNKRDVTFRISGAEQSVYLILTLWRYGVCVGIYPHDVTIQLSGNQITRYKGIMIYHMSNDDKSKSISFLKRHRSMPFGNAFNMFHFDRCCVTQFPAEDQVSATPSLWTDPHPCQVVSRAMGMPQSPVLSTKIDGAPFRKPTHNSFKPYAKFLDPTPVAHPFHLPISKHQGWTLTKMMK